MKQETLFGAREVLTSDKRFRIRFPLPPAHSKVLVPSGTHWRVVQRNIERILNSGHAAQCPITGHKIQIYRRGLHAGQVRTLRRIRDTSKDLGVTWLHVRHFTARRDGDLAKMEYWKLIEHDPARDRCGYWKITALGLCWLNRDLKIPRQVAVLNGECLGPVDSADLIGPDEVAEHFDKDALDVGLDGMPLVAGERVHA
jgi:hypothetical protein